MRYLSLHCFAWRYYLSNYRNGRGLQSFCYSAFAVVMSLLVCNGIYEAYLTHDTLHLLGVSVIGLMIIVYTIGLLLDFRRYCRSASNFAYDALQTCRTKAEIAAYFATLYPGFIP